MIKCLLPAILFLLLAAGSAVASQDDLHASIILQLKNMLMAENVFSYSPREEDIEITISKQRTAYPTSAEAVLTGKFTQLDKRARHFTASLSLQTGSGTLDYTLHGRYDEFIQLPVLKNRLSQGDIVSSADIGELKINADRLKKTTIKHANELIGKTPRHHVNAHMPLDQNELSWPKVIKKGDMVNVIYQRRAILIKATALSLESGAIGDVIKVKNIRSNSILHAQIENSNTVKVLGP